jgi:NAD(P)-dependent dehydrogenase (short-subunit alcohol dehydrogenase family)
MSEEQHNMELKKQVLLIGALGGLGSETTKLLVNQGWHVFAADIQQEVFTNYEHTNDVTPLRIDITDAESIKEAFDLVSGQTAGLDAVIHMAGILKIGSLAELPVSDLKEILDINLLGVYRINKQFLPLILQRKGRIIMLSSEVGRQTAAPFNGMYSISKHALEAYSDALRRELAFLGIKVIKIQPGPFKTAMTKNAEQLFIEAQKNSSYFKKNLSKGITYLPKVYTNAHHPVYVAKTIMKALESTHPKTAYSVKADVPRMMIDLLPVKWADKLIGKVLS